MGSTRTPLLICSFTHGRGIEMTTSYNERDSFSSSYSMLTSHVPSFDGDGQQLTARNVSLPNQNGVRRYGRDVLESGT